MKFDHAALEFWKMAFCAALSGMSRDDPSFDNEIAVDTAADVADLAVKAMHKREELVEAS